MFDKDTKSKMASNNPLLLLFCKPSSPNCICSEKKRQLSKAEQELYHLCHFWSGFYFSHSIMTQQHSSVSHKWKITQMRFACCRSHKRAVNIVWEIRTFDDNGSIQSQQKNLIDFRWNYRAVLATPIFSAATYSQSMVTPFLNGNNIDLQKAFSWKLSLEGGCLKNA